MCVLVSVGICTFMKVHVYMHRCVCNLGLTSVSFSYQSLPLSFESESFTEFEADLLDYAGQCTSETCPGFLVLPWAYLTSF